MNLRYSHVEPFHADVFLQFVGLVVQTRFQAPGKQEEEEELTETIKKNWFRTLRRKTPEDDQFKSKHEVDS